MHYVAIVNGEQRDVEITEVSPEVYLIRFDGKQLEVDARAISDSTLSAVINNESFKIESEAASSGGENLLIRGALLNVEVLDLRTNRLRQVQESKKSVDGPVVIEVPMPGRIVSVLAREGQGISEGDGIVIVEAMKMENELTSPRAGVITDLRVEEGMTVDGGFIVCTVK